MSWVKSREKENSQPPLLPKLGIAKVYSHIFCRFKITCGQFIKNESLALYTSKGKKYFGKIVLKV